MLLLLLVSMFVDNLLVVIVFQMRTLCCLMIDAEWSAWRTRVDTRTDLSSISLFSQPNGWTRNMSHSG